MIALLAGRSFSFALSKIPTSPKTGEKWGTLPCNDSMLVETLQQSYLGQSQPKVPAINRA